MDKENIKYRERSQLFLKDLPWYAMPDDQVLTRLEVDRNGLTEAQAKKRLHEFGPNTLSATKVRSPFARFFLQFNNVLIYVLLVSALITGLLRHWIDTGVILGVVLINAIIGFIQEGKAESAL